MPGSSVGKREDCGIKIFKFSDLEAKPWKNGGGVTRELLRQDEARKTIWRLSIADVESEGPFSAFPGMMRTLTVIDGKGMRLVRPDGSFLSADLMSSVTFSGDEPIAGELPNGSCRDFNVIWNPLHVDASVTRIGRGCSIAAAIPGAERVIVSALAGTMLADGQSMGFGDFAVLAEEPVALRQGCLLLVMIRPSSHP